MVNIDNLENFVINNIEYVLPEQIHDTILDINEATPGIFHIPLSP